MLKILLVDDEREEREGVAYLIRRYGYPLAISQAQNGKKALEYMEAHPVDILFTDVKMPMMSGLELAREVNKSYPETKIIIFSAYGEFDYAKQALEANAVNYLLKPIEIDEFKKVMEDLIGSIEEERLQREERRQENWQNRQNVLYKILTGAHLKTEERERAGMDLFADGASFCMVHVELADNLFETGEDVFLNFVKMYLGEKTEYINLFQNEACLLIREKRYLERDFLEGQLLKLSRDVEAFASEGMFVTVSRTVSSMEELEKEVDAIQEIQRDFFGFGQMIVWTRTRRVQEYYSGDVEAVRKQLMQAVEAGSPELIRRFTDELIGTISASNMMSKLYVQNIFYTVIGAMYDKKPNLRHEQILNSSDVLFRSKNPKDILSLFRKNIYEMLEDMKEETVDDSGIIQKIRNLVEKEYMRDVSLSYVADKVNLAPAYVSYVFKKETGKTLIKYITEIKMEKAKLLLEEGSMRVGEIARACGYENQSYFNRAFKNYYGVTPKQFRENGERQDV